MVYDTIRPLNSSGRGFQYGQDDWVCPVWSLWAHTLPQHVHAAPQAACTRTGLHPWAASCQMAPRCLFSVQVSAAAQALFWCTHCLGESLLFNNRPSSLQLDVVYIHQCKWVAVWMHRHKQVRFRNNFLISPGVVASKAVWFTGEITMTVPLTKIRAVALWKRLVLLSVPCSPHPSSSFAIQSYRCACTSPEWKGDSCDYKEDFWDQKVSTVSCNCV